MTGIATIGDKIVETLYSNRVTSETQESTPLPCPLHSKLGCFLFSKGSSNSGTTLHGGDGGGVSQLILSPIVEGPGKQGCSVWTPFLTKHSRTFQGLARTNFSFFKDSNQRFESTFLVLRQHDCNFNLHFEGLSVFASFRHLRIRVG